MWPLRVYTRKRRAGQRLNLTPAPDAGPQAHAGAPPAAGSGLTHRPGLGTRGGRPPGRLPAGPRRRGAECGRPGVAEGADRARRPSALLRVTGGKSLRENSTLEESQAEKVAPLSELVNDDLQVDSSPSNSELVSGLSLPCDVSSSLLSGSASESHAEDESIEEGLSSFSSPELFRGSDYLDWGRPEPGDRGQCRNSTLLDTSGAVAVEKVLPLQDLSAIVGTSSEYYQKCHTKTVMTFADQNISPKPKYTSSSEPDNAACEVLLAEKTCLSTPKNTKRKPEKDSEDRDTNVQKKLTSPDLQTKVLSSHRGPAPESSPGPSATTLLLPRPPEPALKTTCRIPGQKSRGLLTSTPSSETADLVIDLSSVQKSSFEETFPNVSNYVNSNEIVPVSSLQENPSNEFPSNTSEMCCIIRASPGTRQTKNKGVTVNKKRYSPPEDITEDIIIKTNDRI